MITRRWFLCGIHACFRCIHLWSFFSYSHLLSLLYSPMFVFLRPRVGSTFPRLILVPSVPIQSCWGRLIKPKNPALMGAESFREKVVRAAFLGHFRFSFKFILIPFLPLFLGEFWVCRGLNCPRQHLWTFLGFILLGLGRGFL